MNNLDLDTLEHVTGGVSATCATNTNTNTAITQSLAQIQTSLSSLNTNNQSNQNQWLLPMMMMAFNRRQPTFIAPGTTYIG